MKIIVFKTNRIKSVEDWKVYAPPQNPYLHWKEKHSAKLLAEYILNEISVEDISKVLKECGFIVPKELVCEPEVNTKLPYGRKGRSHDLVMEGNEFVICVEAKVSEPFGNNTIEKEYSGKSENKKKRIQIMLDYIGKSYEEAKKYKYQLLTGLVGTLLEAKKKGKQKCLFLVVSFTGDVEGSIKSHVTNQIDYGKFCSALLGLSSNGGPKVYKIDGTEITGHIKMVEINVCQKFNFNK